MNRAFFFENRVMRYKPTDEIPKKLLKKMFTILENPIYCGELKTNKMTMNQKSPWNYSNKVAYFKLKDKKELNADLEKLKYGKYLLKEMHDQDILDASKKTVELLENKYWDKYLTYTMLGQGKSVYEAEVDACEAIDFINFNIHSKHKLFSDKPFCYPKTNGKNFINYLNYNPIEGFVTSITPFNFTAIALNMIHTPLTYRNPVVWKPSNNSILSNWLLYEILVEAGFPKEAIIFAPSKPEDFKTVLENKDLGLVYFTGSTKGFQNIRKTVELVNNRKHFPRYVAETGGKNSHFADETANIDLVVNETINSSFGYAGQKCSSCDILYVPEKMIFSYIETFRKKLNNLNDFFPKDCMYFNVIDENSLSRLHNIKSKGYPCLSANTPSILQPTVFIAKDGQQLERLDDEIFGPFVVLQGYKDKPVNKLIEISESNDYPLTFSVFTKDMYMKEKAKKIMSCVGNFYINTKSTGSLVGQQPFGSSRLSGTGEKVGWYTEKTAFFTIQSVKEKSHFV